MITKILMDKVASYKNPTQLVTNKKVNLVYGLNGTGKSTISNYLYKSDSDDYQSCRVDGIDTEEILVYNRSFINDNFYETDKLNGIFTLSIENKEAKQQIEKASQFIQELDNQKEKLNTDLLKVADEKDKSVKQAIEKVWEIKKIYTGGDRNLDYCFDKMKNDKKKLFQHLINQEMPDLKPEKDVVAIKREVEELTGEKAQKYEYLPEIRFTEQEIETSSLLKKEIVGNENSSLSDLITKLGNSDWVQKGLDYLPASINQAEVCPFCQQTTITQDFVDDIKDYFTQILRYPDLIYYFTDFYG